MYLDVAALQIATTKHVSFIDNRKYIQEFKSTEAGAIVVPPDLVAIAPPKAALLISKNPYLSYARIAKAYHPILFEPRKEVNTTLVSPNTTIPDSVNLDNGVTIKDGVEIGANTIIGANSTIEKGVRIGKDSWISSNVSLSYCLIGDRAVIHAGVRIGQDGFGFAPGASLHEKVPQLGRVIIGNDVEIGANCCIDRGASVDTEIGDGTKIDNLVQIAHNVVVGKNCLIAGQAGIAGSSKIGDYVMVGGQAGIAGHLNIGTGAKIAAQSGVTKNIASGETVIGFPAQLNRKYWRNLATLKKVAEQNKE